MKASGSGVRLRAGVTLLEILVVIALYVMLVALLVPAIQRVRAAADRLVCANKLRQLGLAFHLFHTDQGHFPPGTVANLPGRAYPYMSWMTHLLPYLEEEKLWQQAVTAYAAHPHFQSAPHLPILGRRLAVFACPSDARQQEVQVYIEFSAAFTSYLGVLGRNHLEEDGVLYLDSATRLGDIFDGSSNTLLVGERPPSVDGHLGWWYAGTGQGNTGSLDATLGVVEENRHPRYYFCTGPNEFGPVNPNNLCNLFRFWSWHPGGANFLFCDASVRFLHYRTHNELMPRLATRAGNEIVDLPD